MGGFLGEGGWEGLGGDWERESIEWRMGNIEGLWIVEGWVVGLDKVRRFRGLICGMRWRMPLENLDDWCWRRSHIPLYRW